MIIIITIMGWILYSLFEGYREALYFYYESKTGREHKSKYDIHVMFNAQRAAALSLALLSFNIITALIMFIGLTALFPFFHDGQYYLTRNNLHKLTYPKRWKDFGDGSAVLDFTWKQRISLLILGIAAVIAAFIF